MPQSGGGCGFPVKPFHVPRPRQALSPDHLHGHDPVETPLAGPIYHPHAALGDHLEQIVIAKGRWFRRRFIGRRTRQRLAKPGRSFHTARAVLVETRLVKASRTEPFRGVWRERRATTRACADI